MIRRAAKLHFPGLPVVVLFPEKYHIKRQFMSVNVYPRLNAVIRWVENYRAAITAENKVVRRGKRNRKWQDAVGEQFVYVGKGFNVFGETQRKFGR